jgi:hypothetical protein
MIALLAGTVALGSATTSANARTQYRGDRTSSYRVTVPGGVFLDFQNNPRWVPVAGTRGVYVVRDDQRPNQDFFRYNNKYYVYANGSWYRANRWNGHYVAVNERNLPPRFHDVPQQHWRAYPPAWQQNHRRM